MKKTPFIFALFVLLIVWAGCSKKLDDLESEKSTTFAAQNRSSNAFALTTNDVNQANGMLVFKDKTTFDAVAESLLELNSDSAFRAEYIASIGPSALDPESPNFVSDPAMQAFEARFGGYHPLREKIREEENAFYDTHSENDIFDEGDIHSGVLRTLMNRNKEIKIGDLIFKDIDEHHSFVILDGDFSTLNTIRSWSDIWRSDLPRNVVRLDDRLQNDQEIGNALFENGCSGSIGYEVTGNTTFTVECYVFYNGNVIKNVDVYWTVKDKNGQILLNTTGVKADIQNVPSSAYPITLVASVTGGPCQPFTVDRVINRENADCTFTPDFTEDPLNLGSLDFFIASQPPCCNSVFYWTVKTSTQTYTGTTSGNSRFHVNVGSGTLQMVVTVTMVNQAGCSATKQFVVDKDCSNSYDKSGQVMYSTSPLPIRKVVARLWIDNKLFYNAFGSKMESKQWFNQFPIYFWRHVPIPLHSFIFRSGSRLSVDCETQFFLTRLPIRSTAASINSYEIKFNGVDITGRTSEVTCDYTITDFGTTLVNIITLSF